MCAQVLLRVTYPMFENVAWTDIALVFLVGVVFGIAALYYIQSLAQKIDRKLEDACTPPPTRLSPLNTAQPSRRRLPRRDNNEVVFPPQTAAQYPRHAPPSQTTTLPPVIPTATSRHDYTRDTHNPTGVAAPEDHDDSGGGGPFPQKKRQTKIANKKDTNTSYADMGVIHEETQEDGSVATVVSSFGGGTTSRRSSLALDLDVNMGLEGHDDQQPHDQQPHDQQPHDQQPHDQQPHDQQPHDQQPHDQQPHDQQPTRGRKSLSVRSNRRRGSPADNSANNSSSGPHGDEDGAPKTRAQPQAKSRAEAPARKPRKPSKKAVEEESACAPPSTSPRSTSHGDDADGDDADRAWVPRTTRRSTRKAQQTSP